MKMLFLLSSICFFLLPHRTPAIQAPAADSLSIFQYLQADQPIPISLITDFQTLELKKYTKDYQPGILICELENGSRDTFNVEVRTRGNARLRVCSEPSLKLKFDKKELRQRGIREEPNTVKLVRPCRSSPLYEQYVLREYFAYVIYNMLTPYSYRVQLIRFTSIHVGKKKKRKKDSREWYSFLIEPDEELAKRNEANLALGRTISSRMLNHEDTEVFALFEYMIGNTDWQVYNSHNVTLLAVQKKDGPRIVPVAYDFDYSGLVFTPYAVVNEKIPRDQVTERYYQGYCREREETLATIRFFQSRQDTIMNYCKSFQWFDRESRQHVCDYLESFFKEIQSQRAIENYILHACGQWLKEY